MKTNTQETVTMMKEFIENNLASLSPINGYEQKTKGTLVDSWNVDTTVYLVGNTNDGMPDNNPYQSAVKLASDNAVGHIYIPVKLTQGVTYTLMWCDATNMHKPHLEEMDRYSIRISKIWQMQPDTSGDKAESLITTSRVWTSQVLRFTPKTSDTYYVSFKGKLRDDKRKRGALVTNVSLTGSYLPVNRNVILKSDSSAMALKKGGVNDAAIYFQLSDSSGQSVGNVSMRMVIDKKGTNAGFVDGDSYLAQTNDSGQFVIQRGAISAGYAVGDASLRITDNNNGQWSFPLSVQGVAQPDWRLSYEGASPIVLRAGEVGTLNVMLTKNKQPAVNESLVCTVDDDEHFKLAYPGGQRTDSSGHFAVKVHALAGATAGMVNISHPGSGSRVIISVQVQAELKKRIIQVQTSGVIVAEGEDKQVVVILVDSGTSQPVVGAELQAVVSDSDSFRASFNGKTDAQGQAILTVHGIKQSLAAGTVTVSADRADPSLVQVTVKKKEHTEGSLSVQSPVYLKPGVQQRVRVQLKGLEQLADHMVTATVNMPDTAHVTCHAINKGLTDAEGVATFSIQATTEGQSTLTFRMPQASEATLEVNVSRHHSELSWAIDSQNILLYPGEMQSTGLNVYVNPPEASNRPAFLEWSIHPDTAQTCAITQDGEERLLGRVDFDGSATAILPRLKAADRDETVNLKLSAAGLPDTAIQVVVAAPEISIHSPGTNENPIGLSGDRIYLGSEDLSQSYIKAQIVGGEVTMPLDNYPVSFAISNPQKAVFTGAKSNSPGRITSETNSKGIVSLPDFKLLNGERGKIHISVFIPGKQTAAGLFYFHIRDSQPIVRLKFAHDDGATLYANSTVIKDSQLQVNTYVGDSGQVLANAGTVTFSIDDSDSKTGTTFITGETTATARVSATGSADCPDIKTGRVGGNSSFILTAVAENSGVTAAHKIVHLKAGF